jgi:MFS family permease
MLTTAFYLAASMTQSPNNNSSQNNGTESAYAWTRLMVLPFNGLVPLYVVSGLFGLFQGGIVPSYALIIREYFTPQQAGSRVGTVLMATLFGMALGGWMSGAIFDLTGSYRAAFVNGIMFNALNLSIVLFLLYRAGPTRRLVIAA